MSVLRRAQTQPSLMTGRRFETRRETHWRSFTSEDRSSFMPIFLPLQPGWRAKGEHEIHADMAAAVGAICLVLAAGIEDGDLLPPMIEPQVPQMARSAATFVPSGWKLERELHQDINGDGRPDLIMVLKGVDPACIVPTELTSEPMDTNPSLLIVAFGTEQGYRLQVANPSIIPRRQDPYTDDPLGTGSLSIRLGVVRLRLAHWRSAGGWGTYNNTLSFRWDGKAFRLIGFDRDHLQRNTGATEKVSVNFVTRKVRVAEGSMGDDVKARVTWTRLPVQSVPTLETFGDGLEYEPKH